MKKIVTKTFNNYFMPLVFAFCFMVAASAQAASLPVGEGSFLIDEPTGANASPMTAYYYRPQAWEDGRPIVLVFHGLKRNAQEYCQGWAQYAEEHNLLVICPEFSAEKYPGVRYYNFANVLDSEEPGGKIQPQKDWVFPAIDRLVSAAKEKAEVKDSKVVLYAHSAGAQLIHRYVLLSGPSKADLIIAANSGWYTLPDKDVDFSYGLGRIPEAAYDLKTAFAKPVVILLGEEDVIRSKVLRKTPEADAQGQNRLERGINFFNMCEAKAAELNTDFTWILRTVPGVGHDGTGMAQGAVPLIEELAR